MSRFDRHDVCLLCRKPRTAHVADDCPPMKKPAEIAVAANRILRHLQDNERAHVSDGELVGALCYCLVFICKANTLPKGELTGLLSNVWDDMHGVPREPMF